MHYDQKVFVIQFPIVKLFIYHLTYYRILLDRYREHQLRNEFWTLTIDAHLLRATINWCMLFGSCSAPTHWKRLVGQSESLTRSFCEELFQATDLDEERWRKYWESMTRFRNKWAAHRELEPFADPVPTFDTALAVAYHYDQWVRNLISPHSLDEPPLELFAASLQQSITPQLDELFRATKSQPDTTTLSELGQP